MSKISFILGFLIAIVFTTSGVKLDIHHIGFKKNIDKNLLKIDDSTALDTLSYTNGYKSNRLISLH